MKQDNFERSDWIFLLKLLAAGALIFLSVFAGMELYRFSAEHELNLWICLIPSCLILLLIPGLFVQRKRRFLALWLVLALVLSVPGSMILQRDYISSITVDTDPPLDVETYLPFQTADQEDFSYYFKGPWLLECSVQEDAPEVELTDDLPVLDGSEYAFRLYSAIVNALYPETTRLGDDHFRLSGAEAGFAALLDGQADIWFGFEPTQEQLAAATDRGIELEVTPIANVSWYFIVHEENPVQYLEEAQVKAIFSGEITNWREVGGNDEPIIVYQNTPGSEPQQILERFMEGNPLMDASTQQTFDFTNGFTQQVAKYRNYPNAIGFTISGFPQKVNSLHILKDDGVAGKFEGSEFEVPLCAVTRKDTDNENVETILDFITSPEGQYLVLWARYSNYYYGWDQNNDNVVNTAPNIVLDDYMPFRDVTKIVKLDHEASLKLQESLPRIDGAAAVFPVYSAFVDAVYPQSTRLYNNDRRDLEELPAYYWFNYSNTVKGYQYLAQRDIDIFFGGFPSDKQIAYAQENDTEFVYTPIGYDAFVFFVHKDNPIDSLTSDQVRSIYSGAITNWSQVGGHDEEIVAYQRNEGSGSQSRLIRFMGDTPLMEPPIDAQIDTMMGITQNVAQFRSSTASIGFSFRYYMEALVANPDLKLLAIDGIAPTAENIASSTYPLTGYLYAVSWAGNENENVQKLLDWVLSPEGQYIIAETGYVPIGPTE